jgi:hypothetical protein
VAPYVAEIYALVFFLLPLTLPHLFILYAQQTKRINRFARSMADYGSHIAVRAKNVPSEDGVDKKLYLGVETPQNLQFFYPIPYFHPNQCT